MLLLALIMLEGKSTQATAVSVGLWSTIPTQSVLGDTTFRVFMSHKFRPCFVELSTELLRRWCERTATHKGADVDAALHRSFVEAQITHILCELAACAGAGAAKPQQAS